MDIEQQLLLSTAPAFFLCARVVVGVALFGNCNVWCCLLLLILALQLVMVVQRLVLVLVVVRGTGNHLTGGVGRV